MLFVGGDALKLEKFRTEFSGDFHNFINNEFVPPGSNEYLDTEDPYTGKKWANIPKSNASDVNKAVEAAKNAKEAWAATNPVKRGKLLFRLADLIDKNYDELASIEVRDNGKLYAEMVGQTQYIAEYFRYYAGLADKIEGRVISTDKLNMFNYTLFEPLGIIGMITPWNSPLMLLTWKLAPALAAGNVAVIKPSEFTSSSTLVFMNLIKEAGFPPGVVNVVCGLGIEAGSAIVNHPDIAKIAFTGSDQSGQIIYEAAAKGIKHVCLELGGKSPNIVFEDADLDAAVAGVISGIFAASGQTCIAGSRLLVQSSIYKKFMTKLLDVASKAKVGNPMLPDTNVGPVATKPQFEKVLGYIDIGKSEGAKCVLGGDVFKGDGPQGGLMVQPTIFTECNNNMRIAREEIFGPVLSTISFDTEDEAFSIANDTAFGLGAGIWTNDIRKAHDGASRINAGTVWVNTYRVVSYTSPFGGYKRSGIGKEGGIEAIMEYMQTKSVWICTKPNTDNPFVMK